MFFLYAAWKIQDRSIIRNEIAATVAVECFMFMLHIILLRYRHYIKLSRNVPTVALFPSVEEEQQAERNGAVVAVVPVGYKK